MRSEPPIPKIASFAGVPLAGKTTLVSALTDTHWTKLESHELEGGTYLRRAFRHNIELRVATGHMFYEEECITHALQGADVIAYVFQNLPDFSDWKGVPYDPTDWQESERDSFEIYTSVASRLGKSPNQIPWIYVRSKVDLPFENPALRLIPCSDRDRVIQTAATRGIGIADLWERLKKETSDN